jgi:hypothetical protein
LTNWGLHFVPKAVIFDYINGIFPAESGNSKLEFFTCLLDSFATHNKNKFKIFDQFSLFLAVNSQFCP